MYINFRHIKNLAHLEKPLFPPLLGFVWLFSKIRGGYLEPRETIIPAQFDPNCQQICWADTLKKDTSG